MPAILRKLVDASISISIGDKERSVGRQRHIGRVVKRCAGAADCAEILAGRSGVGRAAALAEGLDQFSIRGEFLDGVVEIVGEIKGVIGADRDSVGTLEEVFTPGALKLAVAIKDQDGNRAASEDEQAIVRVGCYSGDFDQSRGFGQLTPTRLSVIAQGISPFLETGADLAFDRRTAGGTIGIITASMRTYCEVEPGMLNLCTTYRTPERSLRRRRVLPTQPRLLPAFLVFLVVLFGLGRASLGNTGSPDGDLEFFEKSVRPLLVEKCWPCHGEADKTKGGLRLTSRASVLSGGDSGPAAVARDPAASLLIQAIRYDQETKMPPKGKLPGREIEVLSTWVAMGLPWPSAKDSSTAEMIESTGKRPVDVRRRFWLFEPITAVAAPDVRVKAHARTAIDRFLIADLEKNALSPQDPAGKRTLIRRATFDLIGLPPAPEDISAFLADRSPDAFARVVERLLASPRYGERWGRHWLDVVRYADARDLIQLPAESDFREAWRYRDWVVDAFNRDLPYTEFMRYQVAGDLLPPTNPGGINKDGLIATGMLAIADFVPGDVDKEQMIADYVNDQIDVVSRAFLGLSVACARCHDHKFDPISTEDYYALAGIFFSSRLVPGPVAGNTPLVRAPLLSEDDLKRVHALDAADKSRRAALEQMLPDAGDRAYIDFLRRFALPKLAAYLVAASESRRSQARASGEPIETIAKRQGLDERLLKGFGEYLDRVAAQPSIPRHRALKDAAGGVVVGPRLKESAAGLAKELAALEARKERERALSPKSQSAASSCLIRLRADDPYLVADSDGRVLIWPNRARLPVFARPKSACAGPSGRTWTLAARSGQYSSSTARRCWRFHVACQRPAVCSWCFERPSRPGRADGCWDGKIPTPASTGWVCWPSARVASTWSCEMTADRATWSIRRRSPVSIWCASPGARTGVRCIGTDARRGFRRGSTP